MTGTIFKQGVYFGSFIIDTDNLNIIRYTHNGFFYELSYNAFITMSEAYNLDLYMD